MSAPEPTDLPAGPGPRIVDVMTRYVEFLEPDATAQDAAVMMGELEIGSVPVGSAEQVEGIVTDRDILYRVVAADSRSPRDGRFIAASWT